MPGLLELGIPRGLDVKWRLFRLLEWASAIREELRGVPISKPGLALQRRTEGARKHVWVFASTIGELNAIEPILQQLLPRLPHLGLVLLSDHDYYRDSFVAKYPSAQFATIHHWTTTVQELIEAIPPVLCLLAEIPCLLSDAPCRLPFAFAREIKRSGARLCLVNGWLYGRSPASRMDGIEKRFFERDYLQQFDVMTVQNEDIRLRLVEAGAPQDRVFVTGNTKFDAMTAVPWDIQSAKSPSLIASLVAGGRPILTAGSVTNVAEQELILDAFRPLAVLPSRPLLVIAPRYPDNKERLAILRRLLAERGYTFVFRTSLASPNVAEDVQCLVLDSIGELRDFYAISSMTYVGVNKNLLEPLKFGKRIIVSPGWDPSRPGYPVYRLLVDKAFVCEAETARLAASLTDCIAGINDGESRADFHHSREYESHLGATERTLSILEPIVQRLTSE